MVMGFSLAQHHRRGATLAQDLAEQLPLEADISEDTVLVDMVNGQVRSECNVSSFSFLLYE